MKLKQILPKTKKALIECPCGTRFFWPMIQKRVRCPTCGLPSHARWLYDRRPDKNPQQVA